MATPDPGVTRDPGGSDDFGVLVSTAAVAFADRLGADLSAAGHADFQPWFGFVLRVLVGEALSLRSLAERLEMSSPGALKIVRAMEAAGYVERRPSPDDGRIRLVVPTPRGRDALAAARRVHQRVEDDLAAQVGRDAVRAARTVLTATLAMGSSRVPRVLRPA